MTSINIYNGEKKIKESFFTGEATETAKATEKDTDETTEKDTDETTEKDTDETTEKDTDETTEETEKNNENAVNFVSHIFNNSGLMLLATLLIIYLVIFVFLGMFLRRNEETETTSRITRAFDFIAFTTLIVYILYKYFTADETAKNNVMKTTVAKIVDYYDNPLSLFTTMLFVAVFYVAMYVLGISGMSSKPFSLMLIGSTGIFLVGTLVIHNCLKYFFDIDLLDELRDPSLHKYFVSDKEKDDSNTLFDASGNPIDPIEPAKDEVFNISNNLYTYDDAQAICKAYDSRLATYDEIEAAYNNGAEWCNYGWSSDQMAFFPTQKKTWDELQQSKKHKNSCGRPGVNGGFFANPNIKFGVNCFGAKPKAKDNDQALMDARRDRPYPRTEEERKMDELVEHWKTHAQDKLRVSSFNRDKWSRY
jgi:hypothetical protein